MKDAFKLHHGALSCEGVPLARIAESEGTPTYVYSASMLKANVEALQASFASRPTVICYSVKASSTLALLKLLAEQGAGFDIVSGGELFRVSQAGGSMERVVFSGVGKTDAELAAGLEAGLLFFNVESKEELERLAAIGRQLGRPAPFAIRVNPDVDAKTHRYIATGLKTSKFGVPFDDAFALYERARQLEGLKPVGIDCHIGSQLLDVSPLKEAVGKVAELYRALKHSGLPLTHIDIGGGLGVPYAHEAAPSMKEYARAVLEPLAGVDATLVLEPGRSIVAQAGALLSTVLYNKEGETRHFVIVDAGMNDLLRPALYEAHHEIRPVAPRAGPLKVCHVVGPVCESSDVLGADRALPPLQSGDLVAVMTAGAYGMSMASNYNSRPRPAEVLVEGDSYRVIRARETYADLVRGER